MRKDVRIFIFIVAEHPREALVTGLECGKYNSILIGGSTDKSDEEPLIIYVCYIVETKIKETF